MRWMALSFLVFLMSMQVGCDCFTGVSITNFLDVPVRLDIVKAEGAAFEIEIPPHPSGDTNAFLLAPNRVVAFRPNIMVCPSSDEMANQITSFSISSSKASCSRNFASMLEPMTPGQLLRKVFINAKSCAP